jgi:hypothetical protein
MKNMESENGHQVPTESFKPTILRLENLELKLDKEWLNKFQAFKDWSTEKFHEIELRLNKIEIKLNLIIWGMGALLTGFGIGFWFLLDGIHQILLKLPK